MSINNKRYGLVGYACDSGGTTRGSSAGPNTLRRGGILKLFSQLGATVVDYGDVTSSSTPRAVPVFSSGELKSKNALAVFNSCSSLYDKVSEILADKRIPFVLGGDHSLSIGSVAAIADYCAPKKIGLLWIDAHPDINTTDTSPSGFFFGMSVAVLLGLVPGALASLQKSGPALDFERLSYIGLRDVDPDERTLLLKRSSGAFSMPHVDELGIKEVVDRALKFVTDGTDGFVISFDLDACDPNLTPGTGTPKRGGLTYRESHYILERAVATEKVIGLEIVELNPTLDRSGGTTDVALSLVESMLGKTVL